MCLTNKLSCKDKIINTVLITGICLGILFLILAIIFLLMVPKVNQCYVVSCNSTILILQLGDIIQSFDNQDSYCINYHTSEFYRCYINDNTISLTNNNNSKVKLYTNLFIVISILSPVFCLSSCILAFYIDRFNFINPVLNNVKTAGSIPPLGDFAGA